MFVVVGIPSEEIPETYAYQGPLTGDVTIPGKSPESKYENPPIHPRLVDEGITTFPTHTFRVGLYHRGISPAGMLE